MIAAFRRRLYYLFHLTHTCQNVCQQFVSYIAHNQFNIIFCIRFSFHHLLEIFWEIKPVFVHEFQPLHKESRFTMVGTR